MTVSVYHSSERPCHNSHCSRCFRASPQATLRGHTAPVTSCTFNTENNKLATASRDAVSVDYTMKIGIKLYCVKVEAEKYTNISIATVLYCVNMCTSSYFCLFQSVMIWDMFTALVDPDPTPESTIHACHNDWINSCVWSNIGNFLVRAESNTMFNLRY